MNAIRQLSARLRDDRGSELLEFALSATIYFWIVFALLDVGRAMLDYHTTSYLAQQGSRFAIVHGSSWGTACSTSAPPNFTAVYGCTASNTDVQNFVQSTTASNYNNIVANTTWPGTSPNSLSTCSTAPKGVGCYVNVQVTYTYRPFFALFKKSAINFTASSQKVIQK